MSKRILGAIVVLVAIVVIWKFYGNGIFGKKDTYQAVFLNNGQTYFGKLYDENGLWPTLRDVYYLQVTQSPQPIKAGETTSTNVALIKLGGELHGPTDEMRINRDQILFIEDLRSDSRVLQSILQSKKK